MGTQKHILVPRFLCCFLCSKERKGWLGPGSSQAKIVIHHDQSHSHVQEPGNEAAHYIAPVPFSVPVPFQVPFPIFTHESLLLKHMHKQEQNRTHDKHKHSSSCTENETTLYAPSSHREYQVAQSSKFKLPW